MHRFSSLAGLLDQDIFQSECGSPSSFTAYPGPSRVFLGKRRCGQGDFFLSTIITASYQMQRHLSFRPHSQNVLTSVLQCLVIVRCFLKCILSAGLCIWTSSVWFIPALTFMCIRMVSVCHLMSGECMAGLNMTVFKDGGCSHKPVGQTMALLLFFF